MLEIASSCQLSTLGYTHGLHADSQQSLLKDDGQLRGRYFLAMRDKIRLPLWNVVEAMRFKIILLAYLLIGPERFGFKPWSPFLDESTALGMATLPSARRQNRLWQREYFQKHGLDLESMDLKSSHENSLDLQALRSIPVEPLDIKILREVVKPDYVVWINRHLPGRFGMWRDDRLGEMLRVGKVGGALRRLGVTDRAAVRLQAYNAYLVLLPIQKLLERRSQACRP